MRIVLFTHPFFLNSQSMPRFANMLSNGMLERGHEIIVWSPKARFYKLSFAKFLKKWFGYIDQYIVFPLEVKIKLLNCKKDTLFVFADQALGPWVPLVKNRKHIVHCHDFLALKSALDAIPEKQTSFTGKQYQNFIRNGFSKGKYFISISKKTQEDLHNLHRDKILESSVCYNGLNRPFTPLQRDVSRKLLQQKLNIDLCNGYIMHIGGNQFYKNRTGVIEIYTTWCSMYNLNIPLILIGAKPSEELEKLRKESLYKENIHFVSGLSDEYINSAYSGANCLLFPSLDEGFGWPIIEAMASGCPVITTNKAPMNEIGEEASFYVDRKPIDIDEVQQWREDSAKILGKVINLNALERAEVIEKSIKQAHKFTADYSLNAIETFYKKILAV
ncbi:glycosyltransferase [Flavobacterium agrisoli]|uniref:Glycosyltransferase n=1 Tax=Flavobacterium agrisoli TaxID=2793066 RepID=A0A934PKW7_9FLAO|nr:glycosyltransferase [Flavobacterium agrisoli]MBK0368798.1 glycosyltransferase [Flavobacterium agrisoli]